MFVLGKKSLDTLVGVDPKLVLVVKRAIQLTQVDFRVNIVTGKDRKSTRLNSSHLKLSRMPSSA